MKYIKFTYVDAVTGISVASNPAANGPAFPPVGDLEFAWARESRYPTDVPEFFGTCPDDSDTQIDGVLGVYSQADWVAMRDDEMRARVPVTITMRQARLALLNAGLLAQVDAAINAMPSPQKEAARIEWEYAAEVQRNSGLVLGLGEALGLDAAGLDALFVEASKL